MRDGLARTGPVNSTFDVPTAQRLEPKARSLDLFDLELRSGRAGERFGDLQKIHGPAPGALDDHAHELAFGQLAGALGAPDFFHPLQNCLVFLVALAPRARGAWPWLTLQLTLRGGDAVGVRCTGFIATPFFVN